MVKKKSLRHYILQRQLAGKKGKKEVPITVAGKTLRLDVVTPMKAVEIERSGQPKRIAKAIFRLQKSRKPHKILKVPTWDLQKAAKIRQKMRALNITISNLTGTKYI